MSNKDDKPYVSEDELIAALKARNYAFWGMLVVYVLIFMFNLYKNIPQSGIFTLIVSYILSNLIAILYHRYNKTQMKSYLYSVVIVIFAFIFNLFFYFTQNL